jgi:hypothetical protein
MDVAQENKYQWIRTIGNFKKCHGFTDLLITKKGGAAILSDSKICQTCGAPVIFVGLLNPMNTNKYHKPCKAVRTGSKFPNLVAHPT